MSLLEKALAMQSRRKRAIPPDEEVELAIAFFQGRLTYDQVAQALGSSHRNIGATKMAATLRNAVVAGLVELRPMAALKAVAK